MRISSSVQHEIVCRKCGSTRMALSVNNKKTHCKPCRAAGMRCWADAHPEIKRERDLADRAAHPDRLRLWKAANPERVREHKRVDYERHRDARLASSLAWQRNNPEQVKERQSRRRARKAGADGTHTMAQFRAVVTVQGGACFDCGAVDRPLTRGHLVPLSRGGSDSITNIVAQCRPCNARQGTRLHPIVEALTC